MRRFEELVERLLADELDTAGFRELEALCEEDAERNRELVSRLRFEAELRGLARRLDLVPDVRRRLQEHRVRDGVMKAISSRESARWRRRETGRRVRPRLRAAQRPSRARRLALPVAALLALAVGAVLLVDLDPARTELRVELGAAAELDGHPLAAGAHPLRRGGILQAEEAVIRHPDGSVLRLAGRLEVPAAADGDWRLEAGRLRCRVAARAAAAPFRIRTPHGSVTVLGTRFSIRVVDGRSRVAVDSGRVRVADDTGRRILGPGEEAVLKAASDWQLFIVDPERPSHRRRLRSGDRVSLADFGVEAINLEVLPPPDVQSLRFHMDEQDITKAGSRLPKYLEQKPPYMVYGNATDGPLYAAHPPMGTVELQAEGFADDEGMDFAGERRWTLTFEP